MLHIYTVRRNNSKHFKNDGIIKFDGYQAEIQTIYGQLQNILNIKIEPALDEWDRGYNVDYFIKIKDKYIGLQIKPAGYEYITQIINENNKRKLTRNLLRNMEERFFTLFL